MTTLKDQPPLAAAPTQISVTPPDIGRKLGVFALILIVVGGLSLGLLLTNSAGDADRPDATILTQVEVTERLLRVLHTDEATTEVLYTPSWYYEWSARSEPTVDVAAVGFFLFETIHVGVLDPSLPSFIVTSDGVALTPMRVSSIDSSEHHRVTQLLFAADGPDGRRVVTDGDRLEVAISGNIAGVLAWELDDSFGADVRDRTAEPERGGLRLHHGHGFRPRDRRAERPARGRRDRHLRRCAARCHHDRQ